MRLDTFKPFSLLGFGRLLPRGRTFTITQFLLLDLFLPSVFLGLPLRTPVLLTAITGLRWLPVSGGTFTINQFLAMVISQWGLRSWRELSWGNDLVTGTSLRPDSIDALYKAKSSPVSVCASAASLSWSWNTDSAEFQGSRVDRLCHVTSCRESREALRREEVWMSFKRCRYPAVSI